MERKTTDSMISIEFLRQVLAERRHRENNVRCILKYSSIPNEALYKMIHADAEEISEDNKSED